MHMISVLKKKPENKSLIKPKNKKRSQDIKLMHYDILINSLVFLIEIDLPFIEYHQDH